MVDVAMTQQEKVALIMAAVRARRLPIHGKSSLSVSGTWGIELFQKSAGVFESENDGKWHVLIARPDGTRERTKPVDTMEIALDGLGKTLLNPGSLPAVDMIVAQMNAPCASACDPVQSPTEEE